MAEDRSSVVSKPALRLEEWTFYEHDNAGFPAFGKSDIGIVSHETRRSLHRFLMRLQGLVV
jgi:hypothetical protein